MLKKIKSFLFVNQGVRQTIAKNTFWLAASNIGGRLLRASVIIYAARVLGAEGWGVFSYALSLAALLTIFSDLGVNSILIRETAKVKDPRLRSRIVGTAFIITATLLAVSVLIVFFIAPRFATVPEARAVLPIIAFVIAFDTLRQFGFSLIQAREKMEVEAGLFLATNLAIVFAGFAFLWYAPTVVSFAYAYVLGTAIGMIGTTFVLRHELHAIFSGLSLKLIKPILVGAWPFAISSLVVGLMINTDILMIGFFRDAAAVGYYSSADRLIQFIGVLASIFATSTFPTFARFAARETDKAKIALERSISLSILIALPFALGGVVVASKLVRQLFGDEYLPATEPLQILLLTLVVSFPALLLRNAVFAFGKQNKLILFAIITGGANVALDLALIPRYGIIGAALATFIALILGSAYLISVMKKISSFTVLPHCKKIILSGLGMAGIALILSATHAHLFTVISISAFIYVAFLALLKEPLVNEVRAILR